MSGQIKRGEILSLHRHFVSGVLVSAVMLLAGLLGGCATKGSMSDHGSPQRASDRRIVQSTPSDRRDGLGRWAGVCLLPVLDGAV